MKKKKRSSSSKDRNKKKKISNTSKRKVSSKKKTHRKKNNINKRKKQSARKKSFIKKVPVLVWDILAGIFLSTVLFVIIGSIFFSITTMTGGSMLPLLKQNDRILISKNEEINRFDIVAFDNGREIEFRRVIGLPTEKIRYTDDFLYVDDELVDEKFILNQINESGKKGEVYTQSAQADNGFQTDIIPEDRYLVLGDNRPNATDSRQYGLISKDKIKGKAKMLLFPLRRIDD